LLQDAVLDEIDNVHSEFSRNCNSDARKLLQVSDGSKRNQTIGRFSCQRRSRGAKTSHLMSCDDKTYGGSSSLFPRS
jgi:hypothetical protein